MAAGDHLATYAEGWTRGDADTLLEAMGPDYVLDDPNAGRIAKADFPAYFAELAQQLEEVRGGPPAGNFLELSEIVTEESGGVLTAWCWWTFPGTPIEGSGLIKAGPDGVLSERLAFYTRLPS